MSNEWAHRFDPDLLIQPDDTTGDIPAPPQEDPNVDFGQRIYSLVLDGKHYLAPIAADGAPRKILSVGSKTSTWVKEVATEYPNAEVIGVAPTPIDDKESSQRPANIRFEIKNIEAKDVFEQNAFDFIYSRDVYSEINNWDAYVQNIQKYLAPGGWAEFIEWEIALGCDDDSFNETTACRQFHNTLIEQLRNSGKDINLAQKLKDNVERSGFTNVQQKVAKVPMSEWPKNPQFKELGAATFASTIDLYRYAQVLMGLTPEEAEIFVGRCRQELAGRSVHIYSRIHFVTAQKPKA